MTEKKSKWAQNWQIPKKIKEGKEAIEARLWMGAGTAVGCRGAGDTRGQVTGEWWCHLPVWVWPHRDRAAQCSV